MSACFPILPGTRGRVNRFVILALFIVTFFRSLDVLSAQGIETASDGFPSTVLGQFARSWLTAFNAGDSVSLRSSQADLVPGIVVPGVSVRARTGPLTNVRVLQSSPQHIEFLVKDSATGADRFGLIIVRRNDPARIVYFMLVPPRPGKAINELFMSRSELDSAVRGVGEALRRYYVAPQMGNLLADSLQRRVQRGDYTHIASGRYLAERLTSELPEMSGDRHLRVDFSVPVLPADFYAPPTASERDRKRRQWEQGNCAFVRVERMEGNIGYLKLNGFAPLELCIPTADAAMAFIKGTDGLIIDLRENNGGDQALVTYLASYFFAPHTLLGVRWLRESNAQDSAWTQMVSGPPYGQERPVYVLTSTRTFSAGEAMAFVLQQQHRATIVGETTGGGAHESWPRRVTDHIFAVIPGARFTEAVSLSDWEGRGVQPEIHTPAVEALEEARRQLEMHKGRKP